MSADVAPAHVTPPTAPAAAPGRNWLADIGTVLSSTAAGMKGDLDFVDRINTRKVQQEHEAQKMQLEKNKMALQVFDEMGKASKWITDEDSAARAGESFSNILKSLGVNYPKETAAKALLNPDEIKDTMKAFPELGRMGLSPAQQRKFAQDPLYRDRLLTEFNKIWGKEVFTALLKGKDQTTKINGEDKKLSELTYEQLLDLHPDVGRLTEEDKWQLNEAGYSKIKPKELIAAEKKGAIESAATKAADVRAEKTREAADIRAEKSREAAAERQAKHLDAIAAGLGPAAAARVRKEVEQNSPLDVRATRWVHPDTLKAASPDMTPTEAREAGYAVVSSQLAQAVPSARTALEALNRYEELSKQLLPSVKGKSTAEALAIVQTNRAKMAIKERAGDPLVKDFIALQSTVPTQVKAFGDTGNIAYKESEFALHALPGTEDSLESALLKIRSRRELLKTVVRNSLSSSKTQTGAGGVVKLRRNPQTGKLEEVRE